MFNLVILRKLGSVKSLLIQLISQPMDDLLIVTHHHGCAGREKERIGATGEQKVSSQLALPCLGVLLHQFFALFLEKLQVCHTGGSCLCVLSPGQLRPWWSWWMAGR